VTNFIIKGLRRQATHLGAYGTRTLLCMARLPFTKWSCVPTISQVPAPAIRPGKQPYTCIATLYMYGMIDRNAEKEENNRFSHHWHTRYYPWTPSRVLSLLRSLAQVLNQKRLSFIRSVNRQVQLSWLIKGKEQLHCPGIGRNVDDWVFALVRSLYVCVCHCMCQMTWSTLGYRLCIFF